MTRYDILLEKDPPPCVKPLKKKAPKKREIREALLDETEQSTSNRVDPAVRDSIIESYLSSSDGRRRLAASMANPLRQRLNYSSIARRVLQIDELLPGALPVYEADNRCAYAFDVSRRAIVQLIRRPVPMFEVCSSPQIPLTYLRERRRYALIDRAQDLVVNEIRQSEEESVYMVLQALSNAEESYVVGAEGRELRQLIFESIEFEVRNILSGVNGFRILRQLGGFAVTALEEHNSTITFRGIPASIFRLLPPNEIYLLADPPLVGRLPERSFNVTTNDGYGYIGWNVAEEIGMVGYSGSVARVTLQ